jgi:hypothetical protein
LVAQEGYVMARPISADTPEPRREDIEEFSRLIELHRYDLVRLCYLIFPFGEKGHELEHYNLYPWQMEELQKLSRHLQDPATRYETYRLIVSSGNGAAKTALGSMIMLMLMYTQRLRGRVTANTQPQMSSVVWPEIDVWFRHARFSDVFFEKLGTTIKARKTEMAETWRFDAVTWNKDTPAAMSGLHNKGGALLYWFEEGPGIPAVIWQYSMGAFTETETIKIFMAFGNSDDPESKFEQNMISPEWNARRIDTRTLKHIDQKQIASWLRESGGDEDADDFRVRVRGLPRKSSKDSIIKLEAVQAAIARAKDFDVATVKMLPVILGCDPAWQGGDECVIWYRQGHYCKMLEKYKLDKHKGETHQLTYDKLCQWERTLGADQVNIDQGEGTSVYTLAMNAEKHHWELIAFNNSPNDQVDVSMSEYGNIRAQMYYESSKAIAKTLIIDAKEQEWFAAIEKEFCWTKGARHKRTGKKLAEPKLDIKDRVGKSPDVVDGFVLLFAREVLDRLPENEMGTNRENPQMIGQGAFQMVNHVDPYADLEVDYGYLYD